MIKFSCPNIKSVRVGMNPSRQMSEDADVVNSLQLFGAERPVFAELKDQPQPGVFALPARLLLAKREMMGMPPPQARPSLKVKPLQRKKSNTQLEKRPVSPGSPPHGVQAVATVKPFVRPPEYKKSKPKLAMVLPSRASGVVPPTPLSYERPKSLKPSLKSLRSSREGRPTKRRISFAKSKPKASGDDFQASPKALSP